MEIKIIENKDGGWNVIRLSAKGENMPCETKEELVYWVNKIIQEELQTEPLKEVIG